MGILLVEDSRADALLLQEALRQAEVTTEVEVVGDGERALARLRSGARPELVLLDLNMPRMDGREVLARLQADASLSDIPVLVLTTSSAPGDVALAYARGANAFVRKPLGLDRLIEVATAIRDFWLRSATLPPTDPR